MVNIGSSGGDDLANQIFAGSDNVFLGAVAGATTTDVDKAVIIGVEAGAANMTGGGNADGHDGEDDVGLRDHQLEVADVPNSGDFGQVAGVLAPPVEAADDVEPALT